MWKKISFGYTGTLDKVGSSTMANPLTICISSQLGFYFMILQQFVRLETPKHLKNLFLFPWLNRADFFKKCDLFSQKLCMTSYLRLQNDDMVRFPLVAKRDSGKSRTNPLLEQPRVFQSQQSGNPNAEIYLQMARPCKCFTCIYYKTKKPCHHRKHPPKPKTHPPNYLKKISLIPSYVQL